MRKQVVIVGGGPAGSTSALYLGERGIDAIIIEEAAFPRFHIGESMTGWAAEKVRDFGLGAEMTKHQFPIKRAGTVYGTRGTSKFDVPITRFDGQKRIEVETYQVRRATFDKMLLDTAIDRGARSIRGKAIEPLFDDEGAICAVTVQTESGLETIPADALIDASGRKTWMSGLGFAAKRERGGFENQIAIYSHLTGVVRDPDPDSGNTLLFYKEVDHWAWMIPVDPEVVSLGIVTPSSYFKSKKESKEDFFWRELQEMNSNLAVRVGNVKTVEDVHAASNFSYRIPEFSGKGWLCVGDAHRFIDPFFSFGIHLAMAEAEKAAAFIEQYLDGSLDDSDKPFAAYEVICERGMDVVQDLMASFWANPLGWGYLLHFTDHRSEILDILGGRIYDEEPLEGLLAMRRIIEKSRQRSPAAV